MTNGNTALKLAAHHGIICEDPEPYNGRSSPAVAPKTVEPPADYSRKARHMEESSPRRVSSQWRLDAPRRVWLAILSKWEGEYPFELACMSYRLDMDAGTVKTIRDYARIWKWSKSRVEYNLSGIKAEVESWQNQQDKNRTSLGQEPDKNPANSEGIEESQDSGRTSLGQEPDTYYTTPSPEEEIHPPNPPQGERPKPSRSKASAPRKRDTYRHPLADIERVYAPYLKKADRAAAFRAIDKALDEATAEVLVEAVEEYFRCKRDTPFRFIKNPATFFNNKCWEDDRATWIDNRTASGHSVPERGSGGDVSLRSVIR